eukprot:gene2136-2634_t
MNSKNLELCKGLINNSYIDQASQATGQFNTLISSLLSQRRLPDEGWNDSSIKLFLNQISMMDSNNFIENVGVGEREGRIYSGIVSERHFGLAHGIGRSGDIQEQQPKAAGSSLIQKLTNYLVVDAMRLSGIEKNALSSCLVLPMATGMTITLTLLTLKTKRPATAKYVLWPRIDQKTCLKSIVTAGLVPVVIENVIEAEDTITTDLDAIRLKIKELGADNILCIFSTTSCFAPRQPDKIVEISTICKEFGIGHLINNAYGLQCSKITHLISQSCRLGRVDAFIQSTDKNFMVPVGGAIVAGPSSEFIQDIGKNYPGRASGAPTLDLFITLLSMGKFGWMGLLEERKSQIPYFTQELGKLATKYGERLLNVPGNRISFGMTLCNSNVISNPTMIGSQIYSRSCSGARVIGVTGGKKTVGGLEFNAYGSHINNYHSSYMTVACAIGIKKHDIDIFIQRLDKILKDHHNNNK